MFWELIYLFGSLVPGMGFLLGYLNSNAFPKPLASEEEKKYLQAKINFKKRALPMLMLI